MHRAAPLPTPRALQHAKGRLCVPKCGPYETLLDRSVAVDDKSRLVRVKAFEQDPRQARQADRGDNHKDPHGRSPSLYEPSA